MNSVLVSRAYRFRLYPTEVQDAELREWERQLKWLWNLGHEQRLLAMGRPRDERPGLESAKRGRECLEMAKDAVQAWLEDFSAQAWRHLLEAKRHFRQSQRYYDQARSDRVDYFHQSREMTEILRGADEITRDQLGRVVCSARQEILRDLDKAWQRFYKKLGGKPHFKRRADAVRIYLSTTKHWAIEGQGNKAVLSLAGAASSVGPLEIRMDRDFPKDAKASSCHLVRDVDQWYAVFPLIFSAPAVRPLHDAVGINRGVVHAVADSDGRVVDSPQYYAKAMTKIAKLSRDLDRKTPGGRNYHKAAERLAKAHRKVRRQREWFLHQQSAYYAANYRMIAIEDWSTKGMTEKEPDEKFPTREAKSAINRSILDVGWYELARQLEYKVQTSSGEVRKVPVFDAGGEEIGISSVCSVCGAPLKGPASGRKHMRCEDCEHTELGDENAARNVLVRATEGWPSTPKKAKKTIKIKGRKKRPVTAVNPTVEASGGDPLVGTR